MRGLRGWAAAGLACLAAAGCVSAQGEAEKIARDWCMTIRASQVLPVYPLSEDVRPGDVFLVPVPLSRQAELWRSRGFLPLDQMVTRLHGLPYAEFYGSDYLRGTYADVPHERPGPGSSGVVRMPRAAFPTYTFEVDRGGGLKIALPLQGVPIGLGMLGASRARGDVALKDAYTYGVDSTVAMRALAAWLRANPDVGRTLRSIAGANREELYLRVVTRVFLVGEVAVSVTNASSRGAEAAAGAAPELKIADLAADDPDGAAAAATGLGKVLANLSASVEGAAPGGRLRFVQASSRSVTMTERFDRPLVLGYVGFDVRVFPDGTMSDPIPSFSAMTRQSPPLTPGAWLTYRDNPLEDALLGFLEGAGNRDRLVAWLRERGFTGDPVDLLNSDAPRDAELLAEAAAEFGFGK